MSYLSLTELEENPLITPLRPISKGKFEDWKKSAAPAQRKWVEDSGFRASPGQLCALPDADGVLEAWLFAVGKQGFLYRLASVAAGLPAGSLPP